jgi:Rab guanine nucleotide exchange factor SEC2
MLTSPRFSSSHARSSSVSPLQSSPSRTLWKAKSTTALAKMAAVETAPGLPDAHHAHHKDDPEASLSTIPDPRSTSSSNLSETGSASPRHPDLSNEVAALSDKLINAINHQTTLDDTLAQTRHELAASRARIEQLEAEARAHEEKVSSGQLLARDDVDGEKNKLMADLADERKQKTLVQQEKRGIEAELENLTASLFEEANKMVASANMEREAIEKKNQQLRDQIKDTEQLLASQHEQLTELKTVMQHMSMEATKDATASPQSSTAPASPTTTREDNSIARLLEAMNLSPTMPGTGDVTPAPSTAFTHLIKPVCRTDLPAYEDFRNLIVTSQQSRPHSRVASGNYNGLNVVGLSSLSTVHPPSKNGSSPSLNSASNSNSSSNLPGSFSPNPAEVKGPIPLKETKFFKRLLVEDIEPTLRLDLSPTISWLSRRTIVAALIEGTMVVEPIPESHRNLYGRYTSCAVCGESRKGDENSRTHRLRVNEGEGATKWPLCLLCLEKVRGAGDLVSYVRMIRDGVVKCHDKDEEFEAWEELVRLRERMFWARMAAGVVPAFLRSEKNSPVVPESSELQGEINKDEELQTRELPGQLDSPIPVMDRQDNGGSNGGNGTQDGVDQQLHRDLAESTTPPRPVTHDGIPRVPQTPPPPSKRDSGGFLKVKVPGGFWGNQVNVLH